MNMQMAERLRTFVLDTYLFGDSARMPSDSDSLLQTGVLDSTGVLELIEFLEAEFEISVEESETVPANLDSISGLVRYVSAKRSQDDGAA